MKYFLDTEFIEDGRTIDLISIGIVAEDGREYFAINRDCDFSKANQWVQDNVINLLPPRNPLPTECSPQEWESSLAWKSKETIRDEVAAFLGCMSHSTLKPHENFWLKLLGFYQTQTILRLDDNMPSPEVWAYYADYDWVVFCQLFGTMMDLPNGFPMYCRDLKQEADRFGVDLSATVPQRNEHHALADAHWNKDAWEYLQSMGDGIGQRLD